VIPSLAPGPSVDAPTTPTSKRAERAPAAAPRLHPPGTVRVHPGDSLWLLAAHRLGTRASDADVAAYWPRVFAANRGVIGNNPSLITPGEVLKIPAPTQQELP
jgi:nucleoid-associated protein YgaU